MARRDDPFYLVVRICVCSIQKDRGENRPFCACEHGSRHFEYFDRIQGGTGCRKRGNKNNAIDSIARVGLKADAARHSGALFLFPLFRGGLYFAKTDSAKSENLYRNVVNRTLPNQETDKPYSAKSYSGIC